MGSPIIWGGGTVGKVLSAVPGTAGQAIVSDTSGNLSFGTAPAALSYAQAYFGNASSWSSVSATFVDPTNTGGNSLTVRQSNGITLTAAASNVCGITFTPPVSTAIYLITAQVGFYSNTGTGAGGLQLTDGTTVISLAPGSYAPAVAFITPQVLSGIYVPGTTSAVTVKLQSATSGSETVYIGSPGGAVSIQSSVEWTVTRIDSLVSSGGSGVTRSVNSISSPTTAGATALTDYVYLVSGTTTLTLPTAVGNTNLYTVKNTGANTVSIATTSAQTIDGSASPITLPVANTSLDLISDNANWRIV